ncbi:hypothetical protein KGP17_15360 [Serratia sp. JSRIV001]|uniref:hypothetical protein n=1 Tax=Serratia sp. JSRIV001 TaxID=2831893 RepID=UPI001CBAE442|nr:hypothetical protein [Serratia sp. JSRIV001]UAN43863.1 hypothetical protein KGP17_15360 [Serratia sp. JSRIV001]
MAKRGQLTEAIKQKSMELLGVTITQREMRLMPYVQYCAVNDGFIDHIKTNAEERQILARWEFLRFGTFTGPRLDIEKKFWDAMGEIIWLSYVVYDSQEEAKQ